MDCLLLKGDISNLQTSHSDCYTTTTQTALQKSKVTFFFFNAGATRKKTSKFLLRTAEQRRKAQNKAEPGRTAKNSNSLQQLFLTVSERNDERATIATPLCLDEKLVIFTGRPG